MFRTCGTRPASEASLCLVQSASGYADLPISRHSAEVSAQKLFPIWEMRHNHLVRSANGSNGSGIGLS